MRISKYLKHSVRQIFSNKPSNPTAQVKSVSVNRFNKQLGNVTADELDEILAAVALVIGYNP